MKRRGFLRMLLGAFGAASVADAYLAAPAGAQFGQIHITVTSDCTAFDESITHVREWLEASFSNTPDGGQP